VEPARGGVDLLDAYADVEPGGGMDGRYVPLLRELLAEQGAEPRLEEIADPVATSSTARRASGVLPGPAGEGVARRAYERHVDYHNGPAALGDVDLELGSSRPGRVA
jgi:hypothetical protein